MTRAPRNLRRALSAGGTLILVAIRYAVQADTRDECERALTELCTRLGARPATMPTDIVGRGWLARAIPNPPPAEPEPGHGRGPC